MTLGDATPRYLGWLSGPGSSNLVSAGGTRTLGELRDYIASKSGRPDVIFLGIFDAGSGVHVGNLKYEPIDENSRYAIMGILVGEAEFRGTGVAAEVIAVTGRWLKANRRVDQIVLGVSLDNSAAVKAYEKIGFRFEKTPFYTETERYLSMIWRPEIG